MHILLAYPPPWRIHQAGASFAQELNGDFMTMPYGVLSIAAQLMKRGYQVSTVNLSAFKWDKIRDVIRQIDAEVFGLSCITANRHGVADMADLIREYHPNAHIIVGGPHVTAVPKETLAHYGAIDTVIVGEGEESFMELVDCIAAGKSTKGISGTAWRNAKRIIIGPPRKRIADLDSLASPLEYFSIRTVLTSRGCFGSCTFCASNTMWGRKIRFHSVGYVLDSFEKAVRVHNRKWIAVKDDTFTSNRKRTLELCKGILDRKLNFVWSCDTRADSLDEEVLYAMRLAGCQMISVGVESASPQILRNIRKRVSPEQVVHATNTAKKFGLLIRYYMMIGNRGESMETLRQSIDFLKTAKPNRFTFCGLAFYPGTEEFRLLQDEGNIATNVFFSEDFGTLYAYVGEPRDEESLRNWYLEHSGERYSWDYSMDDHRRVLKLFPQLGAAEMDIGCAYLRSNDLDNSEHHLRQALEKGYPVSRAVWNNLACIAFKRKNTSQATRALEKASRHGPNLIVRINRERLRRWLQYYAPWSSAPKLLLHHNVEHYNRMERLSTAEQPEKPGPINDSLQYCGRNNHRECPSQA